MSFRFGCLAKAEVGEVFGRAASPSACKRSTGEMLSVGEKQWPTSRIFEYTKNYHGPRSRNEYTQLSWTILNGSTLHILGHFFSPIDRRGHAVRMGTVCECHERQKRPVIFSRWVRPFLDSYPRLHFWSSIRVPRLASCLVVSLHREEYLAW